MFISLFQPTIPNSCHWRFQCPYLHLRYLTIIYNCLIIYCTLHIHAMTHNNLITAFTTPFHQSAPNPQPHWWHDWLPNQHCASIRIYFQGVYCNINTLVLYHLSNSNHCWSNSNLHTGTTLTLNVLAGKLYIPPPSFTESHAVPYYICYLPQHPPKLYSNSMTLINTWDYLYK